MYSKTHSAGQAAEFVRKLLATAKRSPASQHDSLVTLLATELRSHGWKIRADHSPEYQRPHKIYGRIPDVIAFHSDGSMAFVVEVETYEGLWTSHTADQWRDLVLVRDLGVGFFVFVPDNLRISARWRAVTLGVILDGVISPQNLRNWNLMSSNDRRSGG